MCQRLELFRVVLAYDDGSVREDEILLLLDEAWEEAAIIESDIATYAVDCEALLGDA
jgi:hypothetical protein